MVLSRDRVVHKKVKQRSCRNSPVFPRGSRRKLCFSNTTSYGQWHIFPFRCQPPSSGKFACPGSHPSLANCKGATVEVEKAGCHNCSSKLCLLFGLLGPRSVQQRQLCRNHNFGTAKLAESKMALSRDVVMQKRWLQGWKDGYDRWPQSEDFTDFDQCIWDPGIAPEILWTRKKPAVCRW